jgi:hypothetical protein
MCVTIAEPQAAVVPRNDGVLTSACADLRLTGSCGRHSVAATLCLNILFVRLRSAEKSQERKHGDKIIWLSLYFTLLLRCGLPRFHSMYLATVTNELYTEWHIKSTFLRCYKSYYWASILYGQPKISKIFAGIRFLQSSQLCVANRSPVKSLGDGQKAVMPNFSPRPLQAVGSLLRRSWRCMQAPGR